MTRKRFHNSWDVHLQARRKHARRVFVSAARLALHLQARAVFRRSQFWP